MQPKANLELYKKAIATFGINNQLEKYREELIECLFALDRYLKESTEENKQELKMELMNYFPPIKKINMEGVSRFNVNPTIHSTHGRSPTTLVVLQTKGLCLTNPTLLNSHRGKLVPRLIMLLDTKYNKSIFSRRRAISYTTNQAKPNGKSYGWSTTDFF